MTLFRSIRLWVRQFITLPKIQYTLEQESTFRLFIQNSVGFEVYNYESKGALQGEHQQEINFSNFPSGMYIVSIITPSGKQSVKVIK